MALVLAVAAGTPGVAGAQSGPFAAVRAYPAGGIAAAGFQGGWPGVRSSPDPGRIESGAWLGYNVTRRRDWGEHDDERGGGFGGGAEVAWFPGDVSGGWFAGTRASVWRLRIDWRDDPPTPLGPVRVGRTDVLVIQPTLRGGYRFRLAGTTDGSHSRGVRLDVEAALGVEINTSVDGEDVGQGAILLIGMKVGL
ncbi:MAG: hypothetical protein HKN17_05270 [Rhodothermales bacterium]|nr:hypothetical protein [Rhodothermales bacterium]